MHGLWEFDWKEWGVSTGDLSPLGLQAHISHTQPPTLFL